MLKNKRKSSSSNEENKAKKVKLAVSVLEKQNNVVHAGQNLVSITSEVVPLPSMEITSSSSVSVINGNKDSLGFVTTSGEIVEHVDSAVELNCVTLDEGEMSNEVCSGGLIQGASGVNLTSSSILSVTEKVPPASMASTSSLGPSCSGEKGDSLVVASTSGINKEVVDSGIESKCVSSDESEMDEDDGLIQGGFGCGYEDGGETDESDLAASFSPEVLNSHAVTSTPFKKPESSYNIVKKGGKGKGLDKEKSGSSGGEKDLSPKAKKKGIFFIFIIYIYIYFVLCFSFFRSCLFSCFWICWTCSCNLF